MKPLSAPVLLSWPGSHSECFPIVSTSCPSREGASIPYPQNIGIIPWTGSGGFSSSLVCDKYYASQDRSSCQRIGSLPYIRHQCIATGYEYSILADYYHGMARSDKMLAQRVYRHHPKVEFSTHISDSQTIENCQSVFAPVLEV